MNDESTLEIFNIYNHTTEISTGRRVRAWCSINIIYQIICGWFCASNPNLTEIDFTMLVKLYPDPMDTGVFARDVDFSTGSTLRALLRDRWSVWREVRYEKPIYNACTLLVVEHTNPRLGDIVLDLGVGTGLIMLVLAEDAGHVVGRDISDGMTE